MKPHLHKTPAYLCTHYYFQISNEHTITHGAEHCVTAAHTLSTYGATALSSQCSYIWRRTKYELTLLSKGLPQNLENSASVLQVEMLDYSTVPSKSKVSCMGEKYHFFQFFIYMKNVNGVKENNFCWVLIFLIQKIKVHEIS
jgi:hypothetical protein